jgi:hypothetical protein
MAIAILFWVFLLSAAGLIAFSGTWISRGFLALIFAATVATAGVRLLVPASHVAIGYLAVDATLLLAALVLVAKLDVFWPIWFGGFQSITVLTEIGRLLLPGEVPAIYGDLAGFWAAPAMIAMAVGISLDRRHGLGDVAAGRFRWRDA